MSEQENTRVVRKVFENFNNHNPDASDPLIADHLRAEATSADGTMNKDQNRMYNHRFVDAFPDIHFELQDLIAQGEKVAASWVAKGTHRAPLALPDGNSIPATNRTVTLPGCTVCEFQNNLIIRQSIYWDQVSFLTQLGLLTPQDLMAKIRR